MILFGRKCDACEKRKRMLAPVLDTMVCEKCWHISRYSYQPYIVRSAKKPEVVHNHDGVPWVMTISEALDRAMTINQQADNANKARRSNPTLFGGSPYIEPTDFIPVEADTWAGHRIDFKQAAKVVA